MGWFGKAVPRSTTGLRDAGGRRNSRSDSATLGPRGSEYPPTHPSCF